VICEGAGSPAEVNLRDRDLANLALARAADLPVLVVGDIDRGGVLAHFAGTLAVLEAADQRHIAGFVVNKFRGDRSLLSPGLDWLEQTTGRPTYGVLPWREGLWLDVEDSLDLDSRAVTVTPPIGRDLLRIAVVRLPRMSNVTDVDALSAEPGVEVRLVTSPAAVRGADLVVLPGSRATVSDLSWLQRQGFGEALLARVAAGGPVIGICGGLQLLGREIEDGVESGAGRVDGLGLLPVTTRYASDKVLTLPTGQWRGHPVTGYAIHHGRPTVESGEAFLDGAHVGSVWGTTWHGIFENDDFRRAFLSQVAAETGRDWVPGSVPFAAVRETRLDALGDLVEEHLDTAAVWRLIEGGVPGDLPTLQTQPVRPGRPGGTGMTADIKWSCCRRPDTELLAARASGADWQVANPARVDPADSVVLDELTAGAAVIVVRLLGGAQAWPGGLEALRATGRPLVVLGRGRARLTRS